MTKEIRNLEWKVHTPNLLREILTNAGTQDLIIPLNIFRLLLWEVGKRSAELNDPALNALMCRLTIYSIADPESPEYDSSAEKDVYQQVVLNAKTDNN